ncbi:MAG TPA: hypothetical protein VEP91_06825 [Solirubrobacterales bacterium]|nr:hypothetical protein [Solirubrobacterales bacterium]
MAPCLLIAGLLLGLAAQVSGEERPLGTLRCGPHSSAVRTLARGPELRVFEDRDGEDLQRVRACGPALPRTIRFGPSPPGGARWSAAVVAPVTVRDFSIAAVERQLEGTDWGSTWLRVLDARSHHLSRCEVGGWAQTPDQNFRRLTLSPKGNLAWVYTRQGQRVLGLCDRDSKVTVLAEGSDLEIQSVEITGVLLLRWTDSSGEHSLFLP